MKAFLSASVLYLWCVNIASPHFTTHWWSTMHTAPCSAVWPYGDYNKEEHTDITLNKQTVSKGKKQKQKGMHDIGFLLIC